MTAVPTFLIIGAARSGTTALVEGLRSDPRVFVTRPKEPHYFALHGTQAAFTGPGDDTTINRVATPITQDYLALYPADPGQYDALGDGSVSSLYYHQRSIRQIQQLVPSAKLVIILRDPVDRAKSAYDYLRSKGHETASSFLAALDLEEERTAAGYQHLWHYAAMSRYADSVEAFLEAFGPKQVGVWFYDDLQNDYEGTLSSVRRFVGADPTPPRTHARPAAVNVSGTPRSALLTRTIRAAAANDASRATLRHLTTFGFRERVRRAVLRKDVLDPRVRAALAPAFRSDLVRLRRLLDGQSVPEWIEQVGDTP